MILTQNFSYKKNFYIPPAGESGQSLIETLILSLTLIALIQSLLMIFWIEINILWMEHQLYQGLVCSAEQRGIERCKKIALKQIQKLQPAGVIQHLKIKNFKKQWKGDLLWRFYRQNFFIRQTLSLPQ